MKTKQLAIVIFLSTICIALLTIGKIRIKNEKQQKQVLTFQQQNQTTQAITTTPTTEQPSPASTPINTVPTTSPLPSKIQIDVPFIPQAPLKHWDNPLFQDGCEEASILMIQYWLQDISTPSPEEAEQEIQDLALFISNHYGHSQDTSAQDTANVATKYTDNTQIFLQDHPTISIIQHELAKGNVIIAPTNGQELHNPHFTEPGPLTHMIVIIGYDNETEEFIAQDPGTQYGEHYRYSFETVLNAIQDYPTGHHEQRVEQQQRIIIVQKPS